MKWDKSHVSRGKILKVFNQGYSICQWSTHAGAGGLVSAREILECRLVQRDDVKCALFQTSPSIHDHILNSIGIDVKPDPKEIRAESFPGTGFALEPLDGVEGDTTLPRNFKITIVSSIDLGGWLSKSLVNLATSQALLDANRKTKAYLNKKFRGIQQ